MFIKNIKKIINSGATDGFTTSIKGGEPQRYIVALTNNNGQTTPNLLTKQINSLKALSQINVGGWTDCKTNKKYIDINTSDNDLNIAKIIAIKFNQLAIWDSLEFKEIRV